MCSQYSVQMMARPQATLPAAFSRRVFLRIRDVHRGGLAYHSGMPRPPNTDEQDFIAALARLGDKSEGAVADVLAAWNLESVRTERAQEYARNVVRVLQAAVDLGNDPTTALRDIENYPVRSFGSKTALGMVEDGRTDDVVAYLQSLSAGYVG